eukprot:scaffold45156_cov63-Phaeocystis_antarctica.AAC.7
MHSVVQSVVDKARVRRRLKLAGACPPPKTRAQRLDVLTGNNLRGVIEACSALDLGALVALPEVEGAGGGEPLSDDDDEAAPGEATSTALSTLAEDGHWRLLIRPLGRLNEPVDSLIRLRRPFPSVAPRACATSARLTARCGGVWRAMAMSLPQGTHTGHHS